MRRRFHSIPPPFALQVSLRATEGSEALAPPRRSRGRAISPSGREGDCFVATLLAMTFWPSNTLVKQTGGGMGEGGS
jgi:hypothetical protein